jgi:hypothetical protein
MACPMLHHEQQGSIGLGTLPEDGDERRIVFAFATHRKRLLQGGLCRLLNLKLMLMEVQHSRLSIFLCLLN